MHFTFKKLVVSTALSVSAISSISESVFASETSEKCISIESVKLIEIIEYQNSEIEALKARVHDLEEPSSKC